MFFARDNLPGLVSSIASNAINKFGRKISGKRAVRAGQGFTLSIFNEDMNDIIKIIRSLENLVLLIVCVTETVKHESKKQEGGTWYSFSTFGCYCGTTCGLFSGKRYYCKRSHESWKRILW